MKYKIIYGEDYIQISILKEKTNRKEVFQEVIYWDKQEWIDDPEVVFSIANAIELAKEGKSLLAKIKMLNSKNK